MNKNTKYCQQIMQILEEYGVRSLTMEQIAEKLGVTKRTLYNHFADRMSMVKAMLDNYAQQNFEQVEQISNQPGLNAVTVQTHIIEFMTNNTQKRLSHIFITSIFDNFPELFKHYDEIRREHTQIYFAKNIERGRSEGLYHNDFDPLIISRYIFNAFDSFWNELLKRNKSEYDINDALRQVTCCLLRGLVTPEGSQILEKEIKRIYKK